MWWCAGSPGTGTRGPATPTGTAWRGWLAGRRWLAAGAAVRRSSTGLEREAALDLEAAYLAAGLRNAVYAFAPERIVLGGGVAHMSGLVERVRGALAAELAGYPGMPEYGRDDFVVLAGLGDLAGPAGALAFAAQARSAGA